MAPPSRPPSIRRGLVAAGFFATVAVSVAIGSADATNDTLDDGRYPPWGAAVDASNASFATPDGGGPDVFVH